MREVSCDLLGVFMTMSSAFLGVFRRFAGGRGEFIKRLILLPLTANAFSQSWKLLTEDRDGVPCNECIVR